MTRSIWTPDRKAAVAATVAKWLGTPHRNRIAIQGKGIDCIFFIREILVDAGICEPFKLPYYHPGQGVGLKCNVMEWVMGQVFNHRKARKPRFGDVLIFAVGKQTNHVGFCLGETMVHASLLEGVKEEPMADQEGKLQAVLRITETGFKSRPEELNIKQFREEAMKHGKW